MALVSSQKYGNRLRKAKWLAYMLIVDRNGWVEICIWLFLIHCPFYIILNRVKNCTKREF
jgi:hypothetical protein